ncbi:50S ribosome-binding GTPase [bacterium]|nr:50S ribosome-binding GTPase [bacterium]
MKSAWRMLEEQLKEIDVVLFLLDARIPRSSQHPQLLDSLRKRPVEQLWVLNKVDLADPERTREWATELRKLHQVVEMQSKSGSGLGPLKGPLASIHERLSQKRSGRSLLERPLRLMVVGLPNVGKSSLLNRLVGRASAKTGKKPGLTRGKSNWVSGPDGILVRDTPGILYPRIETWTQLAHLTACGNVKADVIPRFEVATILLRRLVELEQQHRLPAAAQSLEELGRKLGFLQKGGIVDEERAATWLFNQCFDGKLGNITWEPMHESEPT